MKKVFLLLILFLVVLSLGGCAKVTYERIYNEDSSIVDRITFEIDEQELQSCGYTIEYAKTVIDGYFQYYDFVIVDSVDNVFVYERIYETRAEFDEANGVVDNDGGSDDLFFVNSESESVTPFRNFLVNYFEREWLKFFPNVDESYIDEIEYVYVYATPYKSVTSNADRVYVREDGLYTHEWTFNSFTAREGLIEINQTVLNSTGWYIVAIAVGVIIAAAAIFIFEKVEKENEESKDGR